MDARQPSAWSPYPAPRPLALQQAPGQRAARQQRVLARPKRVTQRRRAARVEPAKAEEGAAKQLARLRPARVEASPQREPARTIRSTPPAAAARGTDSARSTFSPFQASL